MLGTDRPASQSQTCQCVLSSVLPPSTFPLAKKENSIVGGYVRIGKNILSCRISSFTFKYKSHLSPLCACLPMRTVCLHVSDCLKNFIFKRNVYFLLRYG